MPTAANNGTGTVESDNGAEVKILTCLDSGLHLWLAVDRMSR